MKFWYRRGAFAWLLWPAGVLFGWVAFFRRIFYQLRIFRSSHPGIPVIVVGNITAGGSGKTPLVLWIAEFLRAKGWSPGIISRGYKGISEGPIAATIAGDPRLVGDEPIVLSRRSGCPVWVGADRVQVAAVLRRENPKVDVLILDDGLQHYALRRDLEICVVDARGLGNGFHLPAGPLRERAGRLGSVDAVVTHGFSRDKSFAMKLEGEELHRMTDESSRGGGHW